MSETKIPSGRIDGTVEFDFSEVATNDGTVSLPAYSFTSDQDTGIYRIGANDLAISTGGVKALEIDTNQRLTISSTGGSGLRVYGGGGTHQWDIYLNSTNLRFSDNTLGGSVVFDNLVQFASGAAATPSIAFAATPTTGLYTLGDNSIRFAIAGTQRHIFDSNAIATPDGSAGAPSHTFTSETTTGMYRPAANQVALVTNGVLRAKASNSGFSVDSGSLFINGVSISNQDGSAGAPSYTFQSDTTLGVYKASAGNLGFSTAGVLRGRFNSSGLNVDTGSISMNDAASGRILAQDSTASLPSFSWTNDPDTGFYKVNPNQIAVSTGGTLCWTINSDGTVTGQRGTAALHVPGGTASAVSYGFDTDFTTGMFLSGTNQLGFSIGGTAAVNFHKDSLTPLARQGVVTIADTQERSNALFLQGSIHSSPNNNTESGYIELNAGDFDGMYLGQKNGMRFMGNAQTLASITYSAKDNTGRYFTISGGGLGVDANPVPNNQFTIGANTYTIRAYRRANNRLFVYEDITAEAASGTLTNVPYWSTVTRISGVQSLFSDGTVAGPSHSFLNDTDTGFYRIGNNEVGLSLGGVLSVDFAPGWLGITDGIVTRPGLLFQAEPGTGFYRNGTNVIGVAIGGASQYNFLTSDFRPSGDGTQALGSSSAHWATVFCTGVSGTTTNNNAAGGNVGETVIGNLTTFTNFPASTTWGDVTSVSLTAGDWIVTGTYNFLNNGGTTSEIQIAITQTAGNSTSGFTNGRNNSNRRPPTAWTSTNADTMNLTGVRFSLSATTTVYLKYNATWSTTAPQAAGNLIAVRIR